MDSHALITNPLDTQPGSIHHGVYLVSSGVLTALAIFIFGLSAATDKYWIPQPESNHLSYSYAVCALVPVLCFFGATCHTVDYIRLRFYRHRDARANVYTKGEPRY